MSRQEKKVKLAIVGVGDWGKNLVRCFRQLPSVSIKFCYDINLEKMRGIQALFPEISPVSNFKEILKDREVEGVVIATSEKAHFSLAKEALLARKNVFIEKPMAFSVAEAEGLLRLAKKIKKKIMVGHLLEYHPGINKLKEMIKSGELGRVYYVYSQRLNLGKINKQANVLWIFGPHDISTAVYLLDKEPLMVSAIGESYLQNGIEDVVFLNLYFPENVIFHIHLSWLDPHKIRKTTVVGSRKMAVFDDMEATEKIKIYDKGISGKYNSYGDAITLRFGDIYIPKLKMTEPLLLECEHFIDCILKDRAPKTDALSGLRVVKVLEAAQESLSHKGRIIKI